MSEKEVLEVDIPINEMIAHAANSILGGLSVTGELLRHVAGEEAAATFVANVAYRVVASVAEKFKQTEDGVVATIKAHRELLREGSRKEPSDN